MPRGAEGKSGHAHWLVISIVYSQTSTFWCPPAGVCTTDILGQKWLRAACLEEASKTNSSVWYKWIQWRHLRVLTQQKLYLYVVYLFDLTHLLLLRSAWQEHLPVTLNNTVCTVQADLSSSFYNAFVSEYCRSMATWPEFYWKNKCHWRWWMSVFIMGKEERIFFFFFWQLMKAELHLLFSVFALHLWGLCNQTCWLNLPLNV